MLSLGKVRPGGWEYLVEEVASGREDYYAGRGEAPGTWVGRGAAAAGLGGEVTREGLRRLVQDAAHPLTGEALGAPWHGRAPVAAFDATLSAPKSVSVLYACADPATRAHVLAAHRAAVSAAVDHLETHAAFARRGHAGARQVDTEGLVAAAFVHRTSRAKDPQLHTHVLVANRVRATDGRWSALDGTPFHQEAKTAGMTYQAALRAELTARLGVAWGPVSEHGQADIVGMPEGLCAHFAKRRAEIDAEATRRIARWEAVHGRAADAAERRKFFEKVNLDLRPPKARDDADLSGDVHAAWATEARAVGFDPPAWLGAAVPGPRRELPSPAPDAAALAEAATEALQERRATWGRTDAMREAARLLPPGPADAAAVRRAVEAVADRVVGGAAVVRLDRPVVAEAAPAEARRDGLPPTERHHGAVYATAAVLAAEERLSAFARRTTAVTADPTALEAALGSGDLGADQVAAVRRLAAEGRFVDCLVGPAGTGKTAAVRALADAYRTSGVPVVGLAPSAAAAAVLTAEAGIGAETLAKAAAECRAGGTRATRAIPKSAAVVVDEAGMAPTLDLAAVALEVSAAGGRLVLVGDHRQLSAVGAGGMLRTLAEDLGAPELGTVRRFAAPWEGEASLALRAGDAGVVDLYAAAGRIRGGTAEVAEEAAFGAWEEARRAGESVLVMAPDNATVGRLNARARAVLERRGEVGPGLVALADGNEAGVGDVVITRRNDRRNAFGGDFVRNGHRWTVVGTAPDGDEGDVVVRHERSGARVRLAGKYLAEWAQLGYAATVHVAQGATVERAVVVVTEATAADAFYVAMTRGRAANVAYVVTDGAEVDGREATPVEVAKAVVGRASGHESATDVARRLGGPAERLRALEAAVDAEAGADRGDELAWVLGALGRLRGRLGGPEGHPGEAAHRAERLEGLTERRDELAACQDRRAAWLGARPEVVGELGRLRGEVARAKEGPARSPAAIAARSYPEPFTAALAEAAALARAQQEESPARRRPEPDRGRGLGR